MNNKFPQKELEQQLNYVVAIDAYSESNFSISVAVCEGKILEYSARDQQLFDQEVQSMSQYYNCVDIKEVKSVSRENRVYGNNGKIELSEEFKEQLKKSSEEYCNTDNGQRDLELITDWSLVEEIRNLAHKKIENNEKL